MGIDASYRYHEVDMKYCPECGSQLTRRWIGQDARERDVCAACGRLHYQNPRVIVGCIVGVHDRILMCRRAQEPGRGRWAPPSGFLECGETLEQGAARETFEETGVAIAPDRLDLLSVINLAALDQIAVMFRVNLPAEPVLRPGAECLEVAFLSEHEIPERDLAWRKLLGSVPAKVFSELRSGDFAINLITVGSSPKAGFSARDYKLRGG
jgi:ADP-ribose pyrophosphatase YjhB (NUDIX family)